MIIKLQYFHKRIIFLAFFILPLISSSQNIISKKSADPDIVNVLNKIESDSINSYMLKLQSFGTRHALNANRKDIALWIKSKFESFGYLDVVLDSFLYVHYIDTNLKAMQYNVVASYDGNHSPDQFLLLGAHHDCTSSPVNNAPGADDNASGAAGTLEIARVIMQNYTPGYSFKFITFAAEEIGLRGSKSYSDSALKNNMDIELMINLDMIANESSMSGWETTLYDLPNPSWIIDMAHNVADDYTTLSYFDDNLGPFSDQQSFCDNGYTAIMLFESEFSPFYHSVHDSVSHVNIDYCKENLKLACGILMTKDKEAAAITENTELCDLSVYPNPSNGIFNIKYHGPDKVKFEVFNVFGNRILEINENKIKNRMIDLRSFSKGIYFVRMINNDIFTTQKIVIQ